MFVDFGAGRGFNRLALLAVFTKSTMSILNRQGLQTGSSYMTAVMINLIVLMTLMKS